MRVSRVCAALGAACLVVASGAAPAAAEPQTKPNGPWSQPNQTESL